MHLIFEHAKAFINLRLVFCGITSSIKATLPCVRIKAINHIQLLFEQFCWISRIHFLNIISEAPLDPITAISAVGHAKFMSAPMCLEFIGSTVGFH
jgi:hypothetical protein